LIGIVQDQRKTLSQTLPIAMSNMGGPALSWTILR